MAEENQKFRFPPEGDNMASEIPVYVKFSWGQYTRDNKGRSRDAIKGANNYIMVPYPKLFNIASNMKYADSGTIGLGIQEFAKLQLDNLESKADKMLNFMLTGGSAFTFDNMETVLQPGSRRRFTVSMDLVAKSTDQSQAAVDIAKAFQINSVSSWDGGNALVWIHPPLWIAEACDSNGNVLDNWDSMILPSVLANVEVNKNPILDTPFNLLNNSPLAINISLSFVELEPAVNYQGELLNRAEVFYTRGYAPFGLGGQ